MDTYYICAKNLSEIKQKLPWAFTKDDDGKLKVANTHDFSLDLIGEVYKTAPVSDEDGNVIKEGVKYKGYYANIKCSYEQHLKIPRSLLVWPKDPKRRFF
jgi:hypothetical protein